jgi:hypothetical protein
MTDIDALVAEARALFLIGIAPGGEETLVGRLLDALTTERANVAALKAELEAERALSAPSREPDVWRLNKEQSQQFAEAVLAAMEEPHDRL